LARRVVELWGDAAAADGVAFESAADEQASRNQTIMLLHAYLAQLPTNEPKPLAVETAVEAPLIDPMTGEKLGIPLVGVMDLVLPDVDGAVITDFKTTARSNDRLEITHEIQLSSYSYLFRHTSHEPEAGLEIRNLIKTKAPKIETHRYAPRDERHYRRLFSVIRKRRCKSKRWRSSPFPSRDPAAKAVLNSESSTQGVNHGNATHDRNHRCDHRLAEQIAAAGRRRPSTPSPAPASRRPAATLYLEVMLPGRWIMTPCRSFVPAGALSQYSGGASAERRACRTVRHVAAFF
jgi:hypothetical protein